MDGGLVLGPVSSMHPSSIHTNEVGGQDGCKLTWSDLTTFPGTQVTSYIWLVKNECKSCVAENVIVEISPKNPEDGFTSKLSAVSKPIPPGNATDDFLAVPSAFQIGEISFWNVQYVC